MKPCQDSKENENKRNVVMDVRIQPLQTIVDIMLVGISFASPRSDCLQRSMGGPARRARLAAASPQ